MTISARTSRQSAPAVSAKKPTTIEMVQLTCPDAAIAADIGTRFGLRVPDSDGIRDLHERLIVETAEALGECLGERAMQIHLQRIVGAYVGSAFGAGQVYSRAVTEGRDLVSRLSNDDRDDDRDGPVGFESRAERKARFAGEMCMQSHGLRMAAEGAVAAYEQVLGEAWKPFRRPVENPGHSLGRRAIQEQMAAFR